MNSTPAPATPTAILHCRSTQDARDFLEGLVDELLVGAEFVAAGELDRSVLRETRTEALISLQAAVALGWISPAESIEWLAAMTRPSPPPHAPASQLYQLYQLAA